MADQADDSPAAEAEAARDEGGGSGAGEAQKKKKKRKHIEVGSIDESAAHLAIAAHPAAVDAAVAEAAPEAPAVVVGAVGAVEAAAEIERASDAIPDGNTVSETVAADLAGEPVAAEPAVSAELAGAAAAAPVIAVESAAAAGDSKRVKMSIHKTMDDTSDVGAAASMDANASASADEALAHTVAHLIRYAPKQVVRIHTNTNSL